MSRAYLLRVPSPVIIGILAVTISGCAGSHDSEVDNKTSSSTTDQSKRRTDSIRLLALGDSYTIGESVSASERWPMQLVELLRGEGHAVEDPTIVARTGWTTGELLAAIKATPAEGVFDLVTLQIGVNNQFRGLDEAQYVRELGELLELAIEFAGGEPARVVALSIPDWGATPFAAGRDRAAIARDINRFNQQKRERSDRLGCYFVDITAVSREAAVKPSLLASDRLHPSGDMYTRWCKLALPTARRVLSSARQD